MSRFEIQPNEDEATVRKLSRTVVRAAQRGKEELFDKLTADNRERVDKLQKQKPIFYERDESAPTEVLLEPDIQKILPTEFFDNPTGWIESQDNIHRGHTEGELPTGDSVGELWGVPYDISKVKVFSLGAGEGEVLVVSKRIQSDQVQEIDIARRAYEAGLPTPRVLGEVHHHGNMYALFEYIEGINLTAAISRMSKKGKFNYYKEDFFSFCYTEQDFQELVSEYFFGISQEARDEIHKIWCESIDSFKRREFLINVETFVFHTQRDLDRLEENLNYYSSHKLAQGILVDLGFESLEDLKVFDTYKKAEEALRPLAKALLEEVRLDILDSSERIKKIIYEEAFGFDITDEIKRIQQLCVDKGVHHKDFNNRNFVIPWNFETDEPQQGRGETLPRMYLVDWEPKPGSSK